MHILFQRKCNAVIQNFTNPEPFRIKKAYLYLYLGSAFKINAQLSCWNQQ